MLAVKRCRRLHNQRELKRKMPAQRLFLKVKDNTDEENYDEFLEQYRIQGLVKKYSDYIRYPIVMDMTKSRVKEETQGQRQARI